MLGMFPSKLVSAVARTWMTLLCPLLLKPHSVAFDFNAASVTGFDIDHLRIQEARKSFNLRASRVRAATADSARSLDYYPISSLLTHGSLQTDAAATTELAPRQPRPPRVNFISADWVSGQNRATEGPFDVILALSVVKWVHLKHRDEGLVFFFLQCARSLVVGGYLVLEIQPWRSYEKAIRPHKAPHFKENFERLEFRPETYFDRILQELGLTLCETSDALPRRISVYRKQFALRPWKQVRGVGDLRKMIKR
jgi:7SK snRNA methylphosphate capping enzyme